MSPVRPTRPATPSSPTADATRTRAEAARRGRTVALRDSIPLGRAVEFVDEPFLALARVAVRRPDDLLVGDLSWRNFRLVRGTPPRLVRDDAAHPAFLRLELPPQAFGEEAFRTTEQSSVPAPALGALRMRIGGASRLVVRAPSSLVELPYSLAAVLAALRDWPMARARTALADRFEFPGTGGGAPGVLGAVLGDEAQRAVRAELVAALARLGDAALTGAVRAAALRVAESAAQALALPDARAGAAAVRAAVQREVELLVQRHAALREPVVRERVVAALGAQALDALAVRPDPGRTFGDLMARLPLVVAYLEPHRPRPFDTALEVPYRLVLSPIGDVRWRHALAPHAGGARTELWHTRAADPDDPPGRETPTRVRAIWSPDWVRTEAERAALVAHGDADRPFDMPTEPRDRFELVDLMAGYHLDVGGGLTGEPVDDYVPSGATARRLGLTALGAMLDVAGAWPVRPGAISLESWRHRLGLGRDAYVRIVRAGFLLPFGHAAVVITVSERTFEGPAGDRRAILRKRDFIVVRQRTVTFDAARATSGGRDLPFTAVDLLTTVSPDLVAPNDDACLAVDPSLFSGALSGVSRKALFWPCVGVQPSGAGIPLRWELVGTDHDGRRASFAMPLLFVDTSVNVRERSGVPAMRIVQGAYSQGPDTPAGPLRFTNPAIPDGWRAADFGGQHVSVAPDAPDAPSPPRLPVQRMRFRLGDVRTYTAALANAHPALAHADVELPPVRRLLGRAGASVSVAYDRRYVAAGFGAGNPAELFVALRTPLALPFGGGDAARSDVLGAIATPAMTIAGLSRRIGPAADLDALSGESPGRPAAIHPASFFGDARILGGIALADLLDAIPSASPDAPRWTTRELGDRVEARFDWRTTIATSRDDRFLPSAGGPTTFTMAGVVVTPTSGPPEKRAEATLANFRVDIFGQLRLWFTRFTFRAKRGQKADVEIALHAERGVEFGGALEFLDTLRRFIPSDGFSDPPTLEVTPAGLVASYSLALPSIQVGVFALSNLQLAASLALPFDARPMEARFGFATRERPFSLSVSLLGGGGFVALGLGSDGIREVEAALEFGAELAIDLGVASGKVEIKAGVYFSWLVDPEGATVTLAGYVRVHGEVDVLGLISASITLNLQLGFTKEPSRALVFGEASIIVEVEVLVFSGEVEIRCRREFANPDADPTVADLLPSPAPWAEYCAAFAEE